MDQISTRLPASEMEFQSGHAVLAGFLSEVMGTSDSSNTSSFTQYIILATICGRCICHMQQSTVERLYGQVFGDFWQRHQWLEAILTQQTQVLSLQYLLPSERVDPMLLFTNMISHAAFLYLTKIIESVSPETSEHQSTIMEYEKRSLLAAQQIVHLARALSQVSCFKAGLSCCLDASPILIVYQAHPFTPIPLSLCAEFFTTHRDLDEPYGLQLQEISEALRDLRSVNHLAEDYLHLLESDGSDHALTGHTIGE